MLGFWDYVILGIGCLIAVYLIYNMVIEAVKK